MSADEGLQMLRQIFSPEMIAQCKAEAEKGNARAQFIWGSILYTGVGVPRDIELGRSWIRKSGESGHDAAQFALAIAAFKGDPESPTEVVHWAQRAADQGHAQAQSLLVSCFANGYGTSRDPVEARKWMIISGEGGAITRFPKLDPRSPLPEPDEEEAKRRVRTWQAAHPGLAIAVRIGPAPLTKEQISAARKSLAKWVRPTRLFVPVAGDPGPRAITKLGGAPWWPAGRKRPLCTAGHAMSFICQVRLDEVPTLKEPSGSLLSFHYCAECMWEGNMSWGIADKDDEGRPKGLVSYQVDVFQQTASVEPDGMGVTGPKIIEASGIRHDARMELPSDEDDLSPTDMRAVSPEFLRGGLDGHRSVVECDFGCKIGGWPAWDQSPEWPKCREGRQMLFVGQIDYVVGAKTGWGGGGHAYLFICPPACQKRYGELVVQDT